MSYSTTTFEVSNESEFLEAVTACPGNRVRIILKNNFNLRHGDDGTKSYVFGTPNEPCEHLEIDWNGFKTTSKGSKKEATNCFCYYAKIVEVNNQCHSGYLGGGGFNKSNG